jgi:inorganic triphosphatase YgiF
MALETEIKLSLPAMRCAPGARTRLLADSKPIRQKLVNTYYDTPDQAPAAQAPRRALPPERLDMAADRQE